MAADGLAPLGPYRAGLLERLAPLGPVEAGLEDVLGCVLVEDLVAAADIPAFANSAMDGYAVRAVEARAGDRLALVGEVAAGAAPDREVGPGEAVRIMTGAPVPDGADAIVPVEVADEDGGAVVVRAAPTPGAHVRLPGEDVRAGEVLLRAGRVLGPADVGMCAAVGRAVVRVRPRPRVVVLATGDELLEPGEADRPGAVRDSNSWSLTALARESGVPATRARLVRDDREALRAAITDLIREADVLVTTGGVSAGRYDYVKVVLDELGDVRATKVGMQPGMPQAFGFLEAADGRRVACFGLPGNPVSAYVSFEVFVRPALRRLAGRTDLTRARVTAVLEEEVRSPADKVSFLRVRLRRDGADWRARPTGAQGSGILRSLVDADGLAEVAAEQTSVPSGEALTVHLLREAP